MIYAKRFVQTVQVALMFLLKDDTVVKQLLVPLSCQ